MNEQDIGKVSDSEQWKWQPFLCSISLVFRKFLSFDRGQPRSTPSRPRFRVVNEIRGHLTFINWRILGEPPHPVAQIKLFVTGKFPASFLLNKFDYRFAESFSPLSTLPPPLSWLGVNPGRHPGLTSLWHSVKPRAKFPIRLPTNPGWMMSKQV